MTEKIIFDGKEFCDKYDDCSRGCPIWNENNTCYCPIANNGSCEVTITITKKETDVQKICEKYYDACSKGCPTMTLNEYIKKEIEIKKEKYEQDTEPDEFRYLDPKWLIHMSEGLTKGALKHPGESWRDIPAKEHAWRAIRHLVKFIADDTEDDHLGNASMRVMMAWSAAQDNKK